MAKMGINQVEIGSFYDSEKYYNPNPSGEGDVARYFFTGEKVSVALHMIPAGQNGGEHTHPHEQCLIVPAGDGEAIIDGKLYPTEPGFFALIPPELPHGYSTEKASYTCWNLDIFNPARLEYDKDNYFRILAKGEDPMKTRITK